MFAVLRHAGYRERSRFCNRERMAVVRRLQQLDVRPDQLARLFAFAREQGRRPGCLFAYWLDNQEILIARLNEIAIRANAVVQRRNAADVVSDLAAKMRLVE